MGESFYRHRSKQNSAQGKETLPAPRFDPTFGGFAPQNWIPVKSAALVFFRKNLTGKPRLYSFRAISSIYFTGLGGLWRKTTGRGPWRIVQAGADKAWRKSIRCVWRKKWGLAKCLLLLYVNSLRVHSKFLCYTSLYKSIICQFILYYSGEKKPCLI